MAPGTQPLRDEHKELLPLLEQLRIAADLAGQDARGREALDEAHEFLTELLLPHAAGEEAGLYPRVARILGAPDATKTMEMDHAAIRDLTIKLGNLRRQTMGSTPSAGEILELHRLLYGLYALVKVHFEKEEEVYLPLLDQHLSREQLSEMFEAMERAAEESRRAGARL